LRFFDKGHAALAEGNLSSADAVILTSDHYRAMRTGSGCAIKGARVRCEPKSPFMILEHPGSSGGS
jgi:hypothetical protein